MVNIIIYIRPITFIFNYYCFIVIAIIVIVIIIIIIMTVCSI